MQRAERRQAEREGRAIRTLTESDYLLGVSDETRLGALRFRWAGDALFQAPPRAGVPALIELGRLLEVGAASRKRWAHGPPRSTEWPAPSSMTTSSGL